LTGAATRRRGGTAVVLLLASIAALALPGCSSRVRPSPGRPLSLETGVASWYGGKFHGRLTANGEIYDMNALTAAHRTLPFGTVVRVTNLTNGRSIRLRINDRGPFVKGRIIDVSRRAAEELGFIVNGITRVRVEVVSSR
jgi:rare lipoprotein A (peptidoglycan hydrolase)